CRSPHKFGDGSTRRPAALYWPVSLRALPGRDPQLAMNDVTRILSAIEQGDPHAARELLPVVYEELRKLAADRLARERPGQTLQATALVHEAYLRLVGSDNAQRWDGRSHFFAAAAEAMRRILIESARRKKRDKRGGELHRVELDQVSIIPVLPLDELL